MNRRQHVLANPLQYSQATVDRAFWLENTPHAEREPNIYYVGQESYGTGVYDSNNRAYTQPLDENIRKSTGCHSQSSRQPIDPTSRARAYSRASRLWGYAKIYS